MKDFLAHSTVEALKGLVSTLRLVDDDAKPNQDDVMLFGSNRISRNDGIALSNGDEDWYSLLSSSQGNIISAALLGVMLDNSGFIESSSHCEYGYVINLDDNTVEFYEGCQKTKPKGRYRNAPKDDMGYYACTLVNAFSLDDFVKMNKADILLSFYNVKEAA